MPWTFAHPAAVLPLRRLGSLRMPLSGLVVGSLVPDLGYYLGWFDLAAYAHSAAGIVFVCMPVGLLLVVLLLRIRRLLVAPLPEPHHTALANLSPPALWPLRHTARMAGAVLAGAATHIAWDALTHVNGAAVLAFASLRKELLVLAGHPFPVYNVLQHASTLLGLAVLSMAYACWLSRSVTPGQRTVPGKLHGYLPLAVIGAGSAALGVTGALLTANPQGALSVLIVRGSIYSTVAFTAAYVGLALRALPQRER